MRTERLILEENDTSVASGRSMEAIAPAKAESQSPSWWRAAAIGADAVWDSNHGLAAGRNARRERGAEKRAIRN